MKIEYLKAYKKQQPKNKPVNILKSGGYKIQDVAKALNVTRQTVHKWEKLPNKYLKQFKILLQHDKQVLNKLIKDTEIEEKPENFFYRDFV